jgi:hypothetical protein
MKEVLLCAIFATQTQWRAACAALCKEGPLKPATANGPGLIAKAFGCENWNILSAKFAAAQLRAPAAAHEPAPRDGGAPAADLVASPPFPRLKDKTCDELLALAQDTERKRKKFEDAVRIAASLLEARGV